MELLKGLLVFFLTLIASLIIGALIGLLLGFLGRTLGPIATSVILIAIALWITYKVISSFRRKQSEGYYVSKFRRKQSEGYYVSKFAPIATLVKLWALVLLLVLCVAIFNPMTPASTPIHSIATSTATYAPTPSPTPERTATAQTNPVEIAAINIDTEIQADGTIKNTAHLSIEDLGYGDLELIAPDRINLNESGLVRLTIIPDSVLESLLPVSVDLSSANDPIYGIPINDRIQIYPIMIAELKGVNFEINPNGPQKRAVTSNSQVVWSWSILSKASGNQSLVVTISIPVLIDQTNEEISAELKNIPIKVFVEVTSTPTLTPSPRPTSTPTSTYTPMPTFTPTPSPTFTPTVTPTSTPTKTTTQRITDNLTENSSVLIGTILTFLLGIPTVWIAVATYRRQVKKTEQKEKASAIDEVNDLTVEGVQSRVNKIDDLEALEGWLREERQNRNRKSAIEAIMNRIKTLREKGLD